MVRSYALSWSCLLIEAEKRVKHSDPIQVENVNITIFRYRPFALSAGGREQDTIGFEILLEIS
jgi:hypothetical protein